ncbi:WhiB family transcriptional regulator [Streptomyces parvulus]|uniref:WhiB family transcriptional regulator n=1 Tax=Streptomyces parvulus TaxID=146923 RepID=UPI00371D23F9
MSTFEWMARAACLGIDPRTFFPAGRHATEQVREARKVCGPCPVREQCAAYAIAVGEKHGFWGGMSQKELRQKRRRLRAPRRTPAATPERKPRPPAACGTRSGYQRHLREKTEICPPCRQANTDADNRLRRTGTTRVAA